MSIQKYFSQFSILTLLILVVSMLAASISVQTQAPMPPEILEANSELPSTPPETAPEFVQLVADYQEETRLEHALDNLQGEEFTSVTLESNYPLGDDTMTDFMIKKPTDDLENLSADLIGYRNDFLTTLEVAPSEVGKTVEGEKYTADQIKQAQKEEKYLVPKVKQAKVLVREDKQEKIKTKLSKDKKIKELKVSEIKPEEKVKEQDSNPEEKKTDQPAQETSLFSNPLKGIFSRVKTQAQGYPDWVPDYTSVSFFDTDEVGAWVYNDWQSLSGQTATNLSITHGNGSMFLAHKGVNNNNLYVGKANSNGENFLGWQRVPAITLSAPAIEYYWGRVYVTVRSTNDEVYVTYSDNEGGSWQPWQKISGITQRAPELEKLGNKLYLAVRGNDGYPYWRHIANGSNSWSSWIRGNRLTDEKLTLAANGNNKMYLGLKERGTQDAIVNLDITNYSDNNWRMVRGYTKGGFGMVGINNRVCFQLREISDELLQGCTDPGIVNQPEFIRSYLTSRVDPVIDKDWNLMQVGVGAINEENTPNTIQFRRLGFNTNSRGYLTEMKWNNGGQDFQVNNAFEPKISLGNSSSTNQKTYLSKNTREPRACKPDVLYVTSSLPYYYLDTRARFESGDDNSPCDNETTEVSYTIGTTYPRLIENNRIYFNYWVDRKGELNYPRFSYTAQRGENRPDWCWAHWICPTAIDKDEHYGCNSEGGPEFCVWQSRCEVVCTRDFLTPENPNVPGNHFISLTDRSNSYPYYRWVFIKP